MRERRLRKLSGLTTLVSLVALTHYCLFQIANAGEYFEEIVETQSHHDHDHGHSHDSHSHGHDAPDSSEAEEICCTTIENQIRLSSRVTVSKPAFSIDHIIPALTVNDQAETQCPDYDVERNLSPPGFGSSFFVDFLPYYNRPPPVLT